MGGDKEEVLVIGVRLSIQELLRPIGTTVTNLPLVEIRLTGGVGDKGGVQEVLVLKLFVNFLSLNFSQLGLKGRLICLPNGGELTAPFLVLLFGPFLGCLLGVKTFVGRAQGALPFWCLTGTGVAVLGDVIEGCFSYSGSPFLGIYSLF